MNRKLLFSAAFFLVGANLAQASDLPVTYDSDWTGLYATLSAGYSNVSADGEDFDASVPSDQRASDKDNSDGALMGVGLGYNYDLGDFVIGLEGDISVLTNENQLEMKNTVRAEYDWFATGRARAGYDMDGTLIYATGGVALLGVSYEDDNNADDTDTLVGWTAGGGIEHMLSDSLSVKIEGLYADFGSNGVNLSATDTDIDTDMFIARAGLSWRF